MPDTENEPPAAEAPEAAPAAQPKPKAERRPRVGLQVFWGVGRRKTSTARVRVLSGSGKFEINDRPLEGYFPTAMQASAAKHPLELVGMLDKVDVQANVRGGGFTGQSGAVVMGVSRALLEMNAEFKSPLRKAGLLTRDARMVERKKVGRRKARRGFQWCKR